MILIHNSDNSNYGRTQIDAAVFLSIRNWNGMIGKKTFNRLQDIGSKMNWIITQSCLSAFLLKKHLTKNCLKNTNGKRKKAADTV